MFCVIFTNYVNFYPVGGSPAWARGRAEAVASHFHPSCHFRGHPLGKRGDFHLLFFFFLYKGVCLDVCLEVCVLVARKGHRVPWVYSDRRELPRGPWGLTPAPLGGGLGGSVQPWESPMWWWGGPWGCGKRGRHRDTPSLGDPRGHLAMFDGFSGFPLSWGRFSSCSPGWVGKMVAQANLERGNLPASSSRVLRLQVWAVTLGR